MLYALVLCLVAGSRQQSLVSCELRGVRLENSAPILAKTLGLDSLTVDPVLKNDVLLIRTASVDPEILKANLAKVFNATWVHRPEGWYFGQTDEQKAQDKASFDSLRLKRYTTLVNGIHGKSDKMPEFNELSCKKLQQEITALAKVARTDENSEEMGKRFSRIDSNNPSTRFCLNLSRRITPQMFMRLSRNRPKVVFCNHPTSMQVALPIAVDDLVNQMVREQNLWVAVAGKEPVVTKKQKTDDDSDDEGQYSLG